jgi:NDP-sugar pyrophosphorylase family protein
MVLAAGYGERMRPLSEERAKPSLPVMNRPLILHAMDGLARAGVRRVVVNLHHRPRDLEGLLRDQAVAGLEVVLSMEPSILGTAGGVLAALPLLDRDQPLVVLNGDSLGDLDLRALAARHREERDRLETPATLALRPRRPEDPYTTVHLDATGAVCGIGREGRQGAPHVFLGAQVLDPHALGRLPAEGPSGLVTDLYIPLLRRGRRLGALIHSGWWVEVGTPRQYLAAHMELLREGSFLATLPASAGTFRAEPAPVFAGPACRGIRSSSLDQVVCGPDCRLGRGSGIRRTVLGRGAGVGREALIEDSILWEGAQVDDGARVRGRLVMGAGAGATQVPL